ncbi:hypothetical protein [Streptomyces sp. AK08-01B]|uniref:hypothetical protein n=1 Tax=unclassified Streptomyces TaxID=2593676 RepID=UPI0039F62AED
MRAHRFQQCGLQRSHPLAAQLLLALLVAGEAGWGDDGVCQFDDHDLIARQKPPGHG